MTDTFWAGIDSALSELGTAKSADDVIEILNRHGEPSSGDAMFWGSGGDGSVLGSLREAGWSVIWYRAHYHWAAQAPDGSVISYVEGDVYRGNRGSR